jgi:hypothetical protein
VKNTLLKGSLVKLAEWTLFPGQIGTIVDIDCSTDKLDDKNVDKLLKSARSLPPDDYFERLYFSVRVLVSGDIHSFLESDMMLIEQSDIDSHNNIPTN